VVVDNRPGAGGSLGAGEAAKADPDGQTLLMGHIGTLAVNPAMYPRLPYDPLRSFVPVAWVARVPNVLVVPAASPWRSFRPAEPRRGAARAADLFVGRQRQRGPHHVRVPQAAARVFMLHIPTAARRRRSRT
jgi:hypothetical protein